jgi:hypothetical protein
VCHQRRDVARATPHVWTTLALDQSLSCDFENLPHWLHSSGACSLDVYIDSIFWFGPANERRVHAVLQLLHNQMTRIRYFIAQPLHFEELVELFPLETCTQALRMEIFRVRGYGVRELDSEDVVGIGKVHAPKLDYLDLPEGHLLTSFMSPSLLPLRGLNIHAHTFSVSTATFLQFLARCPKLQVFHWFNETGDSAQTDGQFQGVTLSYLKELKFSSIYTPNLTSFLRSLHVPALEILNFGGYLDVLHVLKLLPADSSLPLRHLTLTDVSFSQDDGRELFKRLVNLHSLKIYDSYFPQQIFEALIPEPSMSVSTWPCPSLTHLMLSRVRISESDLTILIRAQTAPNTEPPSPGYLTSVRIENWQNYVRSSDTLAELTQLERAHGTILSFDPPIPLSGRLH